MVRIRTTPKRKPQAGENDSEHEGTTIASCDLGSELSRTRRKHKSKQGTHEIASEQQPETKPTPNKQVVLLRRKKCLECFREETAATASTLKRFMSSMSVPVPLGDSRRQARPCQHNPSRGTTYYDPKGEDGEGREGKVLSVFAGWRAVASAVAIFYSGNMWDNACNRRSWVIGFRFCVPRPCSCFPNKINLSRRRTLEGGERTHVNT